MGRKGDESVQRRHGLGVKEIDMPEPKEDDPDGKEDGADGEVTFDEAVLPLMKWLAAYGHPHMLIIVDSNSAVLMEGVRSISTNEFIKD